jgi:cobalamin biosynthesis protein CobW
LLLEEAFASGDAVRDATASLFRQQLNAPTWWSSTRSTAWTKPLLQAEATVRALAPNVRFLELAYGARLDIRLALGLRLHQAGATVHHHYTPVGMPGERATVAADQRRFNGHAHSGLGAHSHGLSTHKHFHEQDPGWQSFTLRSAARRTRSACARRWPPPPWPNPSCAPRVCAQRRRPAAAAGGARARGGGYKRAGTASHDGKHSELVFIGYHPSRSNVARILAERTGADWT